MVLTGCCCADCVIGSDDFSDTADPPSGWTEVSGSDWQTTSGTLRTATSNAALKFDTAHPRSVSSAYVACKLYGASGDALRIIVNYTDSSNYHFVEFTIGDQNGCMALYRRVSGSNTLISKMRVTAAASTLHQVYVYFSGETTRLFAATFGTDTIYHQEAAGFTGAYVGLGTGSISSTVRFDDFEFQKHKTNEEGETSCPVYDPSCSLLSDNCTRSNDTNIGCSYDEYAGSWSISGNAIATSSSDAQSVIQVKHPFDRANVIMSATISGSASTDVLRLICGRTGPSDYYCAEWTFHSTSGSRSHKLRQCVAGAFTDLASENLTTLSVGASIAAELCFGGDKFSSGNLKISTATPAVASGPFDTALATGSMAGTATFDDVTLSLEGALDKDDWDLDSVDELDCDECPVSCCCGSDIGDEWIVDLGAGGWSDGSCDQCNEIQGEFALNYDAALSASGDCVFLYENTEWCYDQEAFDECDAPDLAGGYYATLRIVLTFPKSEFFETCTPALAITLFNHYAVGDDSVCHAYSTASYSFTFTKASYDNCNDPDLVPMTLSPGSRGAHFSSSLHSALCSGNLPATVTARPA